MRQDYNPTPYSHQWHIFLRRIFKSAEGISEKNTRNTKEKYATEGYIDFIYGSSSIVNLGNLCCMPYRWRSFYISITFVSLLFIHSLVKAKEDLFKKYKFNFRSKIMSVKKVANAEIRAAKKFLKSKKISSERIKSKKVLLS